MLRHQPMLEPLGLSSLDESVYRSLLKETGSSVGKLAALLDAGESQINAALARLESVGLIGKAAGASDTYLATAPGPALELLIRRREEELGQVRVEADELQRSYREMTQPREIGEIIEVVIGREAVCSRLEQLQRVAEHEVWSLSRPPWISKDNEAQPDVVRRGVKYRVVYDASCLDDDELLGNIEEWTKDGEEARILKDLPLKVIGADGFFALVPIGIGDPGMTEGALIVSSSPLLEALRALFESLWMRAAPYGSPGSVDPSDRLPPEATGVLLLLANGVSDQAICRRLGISRTTLHRRVQSIMAVLGATTRFQAGVLAKERGMVPR
jgi:sugar-specific transcriptional regulator TrmB